MPRRASLSHGTASGSDLRRWVATPGVVAPPAAEDTRAAPLLQALHNAYTALRLLPTESIGGTWPPG